MSRGLTASFLTAAAAGTVYPALAASFDFSGGEVNAWTGIGDISVDGITWNGVGDFGGVSPVDETSETRANGVSFTLNGLNSSLVSSILSENYRNRDCSLCLWLFSSLTASTPITSALMFKGRMDQCILEDDGSSARVSINAESRLIDLQRSRERRYTDEDQRAAFPGDVGLECVAGLQDKEIIWGGHSSTSGVGGVAVKPSEESYE